MIINLFFHKIPIYASKYFLRFATANCDRPTGCRWRASSPRLGLVFHRPCPSDFGGKLRPDAGLQLSASSHCTGLVFVFFLFWFRSTYRNTSPNQKFKKNSSFFLWQTAGVTRKIQASLIFRDLALVLYKLSFTSFSSHFVGRQACDIWQANIPPTLCLFFVEKLLSQEFKWQNSY